MTGLTLIFAAINQNTEWYPARGEECYRHLKHCKSQPPEIRSWASSQEKKSVHGSAQQSGIQGQSVSSGFSSVLLAFVPYEHLTANSPVIETESTSSIGAIVTSLAQSPASFAPSVSRDTFDSDSIVDMHVCVPYSTVSHYSTNFTVV